MKKLENEIWKLINSTSEEDILFGLNLIKNNGLTDKFLKKIEKVALPIDEWSSSELYKSVEDYYKVVENSWCESIYSKNKYYRCLKWDAYTRFGEPARIINFNGNITSS